MSIKKQMLEVLDRQLEGKEPLVGVAFTLAPLTLPQVQLVREFVSSFHGKSYKDDEPLPERKPTPVEALAERLAKVEDRLTDLHNRSTHYATDARIDKVAEIIGERISGLVEELATLRDMFDRAETRTVNLFDRHSTDIASLLHPDAPAFPTGGATTAEAAADAVLPVPQRGDRVRLEGLNRNDDALGNGWYDVVGGDEHYTQIELGLDKYGVKRLYNVANHIIKEVRHADH